MCAHSIHMCIAFGGPTLWVKQRSITQVLLHETQRCNPVVHVPEVGAAEVEQVHLHRGVTKNCQGGHGGVVSGAPSAHKDQWVTGSVWHLSKPLLPVGSREETFVRERYEWQLVHVLYS